MSVPVSTAASLPWQRAAWPGEALEGAPPAWHAWFARAWACEADQPRGDSGLGLLTVAQPLIAFAQRQLREELSALPLPSALAALPELLPAQPPIPWLALCAQPTMVLELSLARERGELAGQSPGERFAGYVAGLSDPRAALAVLRRYPVLARQLCELLADWVQARMSFARHLIADLPLLGACLPGGETGALAGVRFGAAETHRHGRTVALVAFAGGTVVYKPRSLAVDLCFDRLLGWFNAQHRAPGLRRLRLLDRGDHGWSEHVAAAPCPVEQAPGYFWRLGALLALAYVTHAFDLHADNVIAAGADPVVIDLEALFHTGGSQPAVRAARLGDPAAQALAASVQVSGLLPGPLTMPDTRTGRPFGVDISPMGITAVRRSLIPVPAARDDGTDLVRLERGYLDVPAPAGRLALPGGGQVSPGRRRDEVVAGFTAAYQSLAAAGEGLLAEGGPLAGCEQAPLRLVQLSTFLYVRLLLESWHPDFQREAADRERALGRIAAGWPGVPHRGELVAADVAALRRGEVPVFETRPGSPDVWLEDGARLPGVLGSPPLAAVRARLRGLGPADLVAQVRVIDAAIAAASPAQPRPLRPRLAPARELAASGPGTLLAAAGEIARALEAAAIREGGRIGWLTAEVVDARHSRLTAAGLDLYGGLPGIGLFLSYLSQAAGGESAARLADEVAAEVVRRCEAAHGLGLLAAPSRRAARAGAFGAVCGSLYYLAHAAVAQRRPAYADAARAFLAPALPERFDPPGPPGPPGLAEGPAGCLAALLALHAAAPGDDLLERAAAAADAVARSVSGGGSGPAYGPAGGALALARWHEVSGDPRAASAARSLLLAETAAPNGPEPGWCHGAAGTALARAELARHAAFADLAGRLTGQARRAADAVDVAADGAADDSLCHGRLGMALALAAVPRSPELGSPDLAERVAGWLPSSPAGWRLGIAGQAPGLLAGLAGVGFGLIAAARPGQVPQLLLFAPPGVAGTGREPG